MTAPVPEPVAPKPDPKDPRTPLAGIVAREWIGFLKSATT